MTEFPFLEIKPKIPSILLDAFLKSIKDIDISTVIDVPNEAWVDFTFKGYKFQAHRDYEEWRFFDKTGCPYDIKYKLSEILKYAENHTKFWPFLLKGMLFNRKMR